MDTPRDIHIFRDIYLLRQNNIATIIIFVKRVTQHVPNLTNKISLYIFAFLFIAPETKGEI